MTLDVKIVGTGRAPGLAAVFDSHKFLSLFHSFGRLLSMTEEVEYRCVCCHDAKPASEMIDTMHCKCQYPTACMQCFQEHFKTLLDSADGTQSIKIPDTCWACQTRFSDRLKLFEDTGAIAIGFPFQRSWVYWIESVLVWCMAVALQTPLLLLFADRSYVPVWALHGCIVALAALYIARSLLEKRNRLYSFNQGSVEMIMISEELAQILAVDYWPPTMCVIAQLLYLSGERGAIACCTVMAAILDSASKHQRSIDRSAFWLGLLMCKLAQMTLDMVDGTVVATLFWRPLGNPIGLAVVFCIAFYWSTLSIVSRLNQSVACSDCGRTHCASVAGIRGQKRKHGVSWIDACDRIHNYPFAYIGVGGAFIAVVFFTVISVLWYWYSDEVPSLSMAHRQGVDLAMISGLLSGFSSVGPENMHWWTYLKRTLMVRIWPDYASTRNGQRNLLKPLVEKQTLLLENTPYCRSAVLVYKTERSRSHGDLFRHVEAAIS